MSLDTSRLSREGQFLGSVKLDGDMARGIHFELPEKDGKPKVRGVIISVGRYSVIEFYSLIGGILPVGSTAERIEYFPNEQSLAFVREALNRTYGL